MAKRKPKKPDKPAKVYKRHAGRDWTKEEWKAAFVLRAITFPVIGPVDGTWEELRAALASSWAESTSLANWAMTELVKSDVQRKPGQEKCPPMPPIYLYGIAGKKYSGWKAWAGCMGSANSVLRSVERKYAGKGGVRYGVIWTRSISLPTYRYPFPYPVHNQSWTAFADDGNRPCIKVSLAGRKWTLRLKGGADMARQLAGFRQLVSGAGVQGELAIYRVNAGNGDHRNGTSETGHDGSPRQYSRVMAKLVAWLPRAKPAERILSMLVRTDPNAFCVAKIDGRAPWIINADHVRRWQAEHAAYRQRMAEDMKFEKRWPKEQRKRMNESRERRCEKHRNRVKTFIGQVTAAIVGYAQRNGVASVFYDDSNREYLSSFAWHDAEATLAYKLDGAGIGLVATNSKSDDGDDQQEAVV